MVNVQSGMREWQLLSEPVAGDLRHVVEGEDHLFTLSQKVPQVPVRRVLHNQAKRATCTLSSTNCHSNHRGFRANLE